MSFVAAALFCAQTALAQSSACADLFYGKNPAGMNPAGQTKQYSDGHYSGQMHNGKRCGAGTLYIDNGSLQDGMWDNNLFVFGTVKNTKGAIRVGWFLPDGKLKDTEPGVDVIEINSSGDFYKGQLKGGLRSGEGEYLGSSGKQMYYRGGWSEGDFQGQGALCSYTGAWMYVGGWLENERSGKGLLRYFNEDHFEGIWKNDEPAFVFGYQKSVPSVWYTSNGESEFTMASAWCADNGILSIKACDAEIAKRAALKVVGSAQKLKDISICEEFKAPLRADKARVLEIVGELEEAR